MESKWAVVATWRFSLPGVELCAPLLSAGGSAFDAAEQAARMVEDDPDVTTVGSFSFPNAMGEIELDAGFMRGRDLALGCVLGLQGYANPVSVARKVMEACPHTVLIGRGAEDFAAAHGFPRAILVNDAMRAAWDKKRREAQKPSGHDTVGVAALDTAGEVAAATSTSGLAMKLRGRVGDSALVGSGLYADSDVGAAAATGVVEDIMRGCTSFVAMELMRGGMHPQQAAEEAVRRTHRRIARHRGDVGNIAVVCMNRAGQFGGAANHEGFTYAGASWEREPAYYEIKAEDIVK